MGLFDEITFEYELPEEFAAYQNETFQTKDLECFMTEFKVTKEGRLINIIYGTRDLTEEEKEEWKGHPFPPIYKRDGTVTEQDMDYHGDIRCYSSLNKDWKNTWLELILRFTHGTLESIKEYTVEMQNTRRYYI